MPPALDHCSPLADSKVKTGTKQKIQHSCVPYETLLLIAKLYNAQHDDKIEISKRKSHSKLWKALQERLKPVCKSSNTEACWIEQPFVKNSKKYDNVARWYRPKKPTSWYQEERKWLNTYDILNVMQQYADAVPSMEFVGVFPCDFAKRPYPGVNRCVVQEMCDIDMERLWKENKKSLAVIFNTDDSKGPGQHWVAAYVGFDPRRRNYGVYFYDSVANPPQKEFVEFMEEMRKQLEKLHPKHKKKIEFEWNKVQRQRKNFDCGVFSMLFLINMMKYRFEKVCKSMGTDDQVAKYRDILYRPSKF
jgi:hypothetical protein